jgi:hypothetical protein
MGDAKDEKVFLWKNQNWDGFETAKLKKSFPDWGFEGENEPDGQFSNLGRKRRL